MSLVGSVSLTNNINGLYLGKVNIDNLNINSNQILYSNDGVNISGLNISNGLQELSGNLSTIGNPNIQLTSNSLYVNDNISTIQSGVENATAGCTIFISSGSYGQAVTIANKYNISLISPTSNNGTICEILNGLTITGTSELIRLNNLQIKGSPIEIYGVGRHLINNCIFSGTVGSPQNITIGKNSTQYMTFTNCQFSQYSNVTISNTFASVVYFINCSFEGGSITCSQASPLQVIFNNCSGLNLTGSNYTKIGVTTNNLNIPQLDITGGEINTKNINLSTSGTLLFPNQSYINISGSSSSSLTNNVLLTNGISGLLWKEIPKTLIHFVNSSSGNQLTPLSAGTINLYTKVGEIIYASKTTVINYSFNIDVSGGSDILTITLRNDNDLSTLQTYKFNVPSGSQTITGQFNFTTPNSTTLNYTILASITTHTISIDTNSAYGITITQVV